MTENDQLKSALGQARESAVQSECIALATRIDPIVCMARCVHCFSGSLSCGACIRAARCSLQQALDASYSQQESRSIPSALLEKLHNRVLALTKQVATLLLRATHKNTETERPVLHC